MSIMASGSKEKIVDPVEAQAQPIAQRALAACGRGLNSNVILRLCYLLILVKGLSLAVDVLLSESGSPHTVFRVSTVKNLYLFPIMHYTDISDAVPTQGDRSPFDLPLEGEGEEDGEEEVMPPVIAAKDMQLTVREPKQGSTVVDGERLDGIGNELDKEGESSAVEAGKRMIELSLPYRPMRSQYNVSFGVCIMINSLDDMRKFKFNWLPSFVTSLTRKETSKFRFTLYMGLSRTDLIRFNLDFLRPKWLTLRPITDKPLVSMLGIAARMNDFVLAVDPNGKFTSRYWAMLALRRMNRIEPLGGCYLNLSTTDSGTEGLIISSRVFTVLQLVNHKADEIASFLRDAYKESPMRGGRTFYRPSATAIATEQIHQDLSRNEGLSYALQRTTDVRFQHASLKFIAGRGVDALGTSYYQHFRRAQSEASKRLASAMPKSMGASPLNLLIVSTVSSKSESVQGFRNTVSHFRAEQERQDKLFGTHDDVKFVLNFYEDKSAIWNETLREYSSFVLKEVHGFKCKIRT